MLFVLVLGCIFIKIIYMTTCRSLDLLFNFRFISIIITQLIGFVGCLCFPSKLGGFIAMNILIKISDERNFCIPWFQKFRTNWKWNHSLLRVISLNYFWIYCIFRWLIHTYKYPFEISLHMFSINIFNKIKLIQ